MRGCWSTMQCALLSYSTVNLGDEIQSIAAQQFLPSTDSLVDRDQLNRLPNGAVGEYKILLNGWHTHKPENWPPSPKLIPLITSFHITGETYSKDQYCARPSDVLLEEKNLAYFRAHAPIGTRDLWTRDLLRQKGVESYFSGCLTLTLGSGRPKIRKNYVCAVDVEGPILDRLRNRVSDPLLTLTHIDPRPGSFNERCHRARRLLSIYAQAKLVVTSRLHCALPCLALQTPVLLIHMAPDSYRFTGLSDLLRCCSVKDFLEGRYEFNVNNPPPNKTTYLRYREELIRTVNRFIGEDTAKLDAPLHPFVPHLPILFDDVTSIKNHPAAIARGRDRLKSAFRMLAGGS